MPSSFNKIDGGTRIDFEGRESSLPGIPTFTGMSDATRTSRMRIGVPPEGGPHPRLPLFNYRERRFSKVTATWCPEAAARLGTSKTTHAVDGSAARESEAGAHICHE